MRVGIGVGVGRSVRTGGASPRVGVRVAERRVGVGILVAYVLPAFLEQYRC